MNWIVEHGRLALIAFGLFVYVPTVFAALAWLGRWLERREERLPVLTILRRSPVELAPRVASEPVAAPIEPPDEYSDLDLDCELGRRRRKLVRRARRTGKNS